MYDWNNTLCILIQYKNLLNSASNEDNFFLILHRFNT